MIALPTWVEITASTCCLINIWLAARASLWNWLFGIITVSLYFIIFYQAKLYADMVLQCIYFALQWYGLYQWRFGGASNTALKISHATYSVMIISALTITTSSILIASILARYTDSSTIYIDAITTAISLTAQWMMSQKWIEHWLLWIIVDILSIQMYYSKQLFFTAGLYGLLLFLCLAGWRHWQQELVNDKIEMLEPAQK